MSQNKTSKTELTKSDVQLFSDIKQLVEESRSNVAQTVNSTLTAMYWNIGKKINDNDFKLDLLFFHRKLKRLVAIELKLGKFKASYKGKWNYIYVGSKNTKQNPMNNSLSV